MAIIQASIWSVLPVLCGQFIHVWTRVWKMKWNSHAILEA